MQYGSVWSRGWLLAMAMVLLAGCASGSERMNDLQRVQYDYSAAIRWNDFEGAWTLVDPEYQQKHPMTKLEFERYQQIQVAGYSVLGSQVAADDLHARQEVQISVINKHNMTERSYRYTELWEYDPEHKRWWLAVGLPDFWAGE